MFALNLRALLKRMSCGSTHNRVDISLSFEGKEAGNYIQGPKPMHIGSIKLRMVFMIRMTIGPHDHLSTLRGREGDEGGTLNSSILDRVGAKPVVGWPFHHRQNPPPFGVGETSPVIRID
jgi:hypothetical protein